MKKLLGVVVMTSFMLFASACGNKALDAANAAATAYNTAAETFNEHAEPYNEAVEKITEANDKLQAEIDACQEVINKGEEAFDPTTLENLKTAMSDAADGKTAVPDELTIYETMTVPEKASKTELEELTAKLTSDTETMNGFSFPEIPEVPDYSEKMDVLSEARQIYEDSIQSLMQVTAPTDEFVIERIQTVDTITMIAPVTEDHDPNGQLNKQGGYIGCVYFRDSQVDQSKLYISGDPNDVVEIGTDGGGAVEVFRTVEEAQARDAYLASFDGTMLTSGSHYVKGTCIIRTSDQLNGTQQLELTDKITQALTRVEH